MSDRINPPQIAPSEPLSVTLAAKQWNLVLTTMNEGIGLMVALVADIQRQCLLEGQTVQRMRSPPEPPIVHPRPNGEEQRERV